MINKLSPHELLKRLEELHTPELLLSVELMTQKAFERARRDALCALSHLSGVSAVMRVEVNLRSLLMYLVDIIKEGGKETPSLEELIEEYIKGEREDPRQGTREAQRDHKRLAHELLSVFRHHLTGQQRRSARSRELLNSRPGTLTVCPRAFLKLSDEGRLYLYAHEALHLYLRHPWRGEGLEPDLWQRASDHEVNALLRASASIRVPAGAFFLHEMAARSAESVYLHLLAQREERQRGGHVDPRGHTEEDMVNPSHEWRPEDNEACARWLRSGREGQSTEGAISDLNKRLLAILGPSPEAEAVASQEDERLVTARSEASPSRGAGTSELERQLCHLRDQASARGVIPWRALLARFNHTRAHAYSATRHRRRFIHRDLYLPSYRGEGIKLVVALDTSGSTVGLLPSFLKEVQEVLRACPRFELTLIQCSEHVSQVDHFSHKQREQIGATRVVGGGGTRFAPVFERVALEPGRAPDLLLYFTDGAGPSVEKAPPYPVLWVLAGGRGRPAGFGVEVPLATEGAHKGAWSWGA